jgi:hypothetical protein
MNVSDPSINRLLDQISEHYRSNIASRFIRPVLLQLPLDKQSWDLIEDLAKGSNQSVHLEELYRKILAAAQFVALARRELGSNIRKRVTALGGGGSDKVLRDMAVNNFGSNLRVFADLLNELFIKLVEIDRLESKNRLPLYAKLPELANVGHLLIGG